MNAIKFDLQRFANSVQATKSSDNSYIIKVGDTTLNGSGTVNVNGYALTLAI